MALLVIYTCPEKEAGKVSQISNHMFHSIKVNPFWVSAQQQIAVNVSDIITRTNREISKIITESCWTRQAVRDDIRKFSNYLLGQTGVVDPETGETYKVETGHNYYWINTGTDQIFGTETHTRPDINFSLLKEF